MFESANFGDALVAVKSPSEPSQLDRIEAMLSELLSEIAAIKAIAEKVKDEAAPAIASLSKSPIGRMLGL